MIDLARPSLPFPSGPLLEAEWVVMARRLRLSPRQVEIVRDVMRNEKEQTIAARLGISGHTVHTHVKRIYARLRVASRVELVARLFAEYAALARQEAREGQQAGRLKIRRAAA
jgi:DNA-binding CsgD family transcriptional regulator